MEEYFFVAVSNRENLRLCLEWSMAGFPDTINGVWAYCDIKVGDFITFLYGAKAYNLYRVVGKKAVRNPEALPPPWKPIFFERSGRTCHFPFRLELEPVRSFEVSLARQEFSYIAENLLQRGGYWKTHFQADQNTLYQVSNIPESPLQLPQPLGEKIGSGEVGAETFEPTFVRERGRVAGAYPMREVIVQSLLRQHLREPEVLQRLLRRLGIEGEEELEVLGEKALAEGYVDILIKRARPRGKNLMIAVEVKLGRAGRREMEQLRRYMEELGEECRAGVLLAERLSGDSPPEGVHPVRYSFGLNLSQPHTFQELQHALSLEI